MDAARIDEDKSVRENSRRLGVAKTALLRRLKKSGSVCRQYFLTTEQKQNIVALRREGRSYRDIAAAVDCSIGSVYYHIHKPHDKYICECGLVLETRECVRCKSVGKSGHNVRPWISFRQ